MHLISIIIPLAPNEQAGSELKDSLNKLENVEILWIQPKKNNQQKNRLKKINGRAYAMNIGARKAKGNYLWFLHADSEIDKKTLSALNQCIKKHPFDLIYFDLKFDSNLILMKINQLGANIRSKFFKLPFGDQGFCLHKDIFKKLKGYPENVKYGEDHLLVWSVLQNGLKVVSTNHSITTSSRKYQTKGWLSTTLLHQYLFFKQALPQLFKFIQIRFLTKK